MRRILATVGVFVAVVALSETLRSQSGGGREAPPAGLDDPRPIEAVDAVFTEEILHYESMVALVDPKHIRMDQRIRAGRFEVYGIELGPIEKTLAAARHLVDYRADITVDAIRKAMAAVGR